MLYNTILYYTIPYYVVFPLIKPLVITSPPQTAADASFLADLLVMFREQAPMYICMYVCVYIYIYIYQLLLLLLMIIIIMIQIRGMLREQAPSASG